MKIFNVVGARPNLVKMAPLIREMERFPDVERVLVHTGQHYDAQLSDVFFRQMNIPEPDVNLGVGSGSQSWQTAEIMKRVEPVLLQHHPDVVLVVGDVNSTLAVSVVAVKIGVPIAHVEAGLRSFDRTMPEEINRILTDAVAEYLFVTEENAIANLLREGRSRNRIYFVGNVMIDALKQFLPLARNSGVGEVLGLANGTGLRPFGVLTLHRPSNVDSPEKLDRLLSVISHATEDLPIVFPVHPRTQAMMAGFEPTKWPNIRFTAPLGYLDFLYLLSQAKIVLTDSGGIQEETTALSVPCLTLRENTERPVTIAQGTNQLVGFDPTKIRMAVELVFAGKWKVGKSPEMWDGRAAERILNILRGDAPCRITERGHGKLLSSMD